MPLLETKPTHVLRDVACPVHSQDSSYGNLLIAESGIAAAQVPLFKTAVVDGRRTVTDIEPVFSSRLNPGNTFLVIIEVTGHAHLESSAADDSFSLH